MIEFKFKQRQPDDTIIYQYHTEFGWIDIKIWYDGSHEINCKHSTYDELMEVLNDISQKVWLKTSMIPELTEHIAKMMGNLNKLYEDDNDE